MSDAAMTNMERAVAIVNSKRRCNNPHSPGQRVVGFIVDEEIAGLSPALFALDEVVKVFNAHGNRTPDWRSSTTEERTVIELLAALRTAANYIDEGQLVTARAMMEDLLAKHGGVQ